MPRKTLIQSIAAAQKAERAAERAKNQLYASIAAAAREISRLEAQVASKRSTLHCALVESDSPYTVDQIVTRAGQKHIDAALRDHYARNDAVTATPATRKPKTIRRVRTDDVPTMASDPVPVAPQLDTDCYHLVLQPQYMVRKNGWNENQDRVGKLVSPRMEPIYNDRIDQKWELSRTAGGENQEKRLIKRFWPIYQSKWKHQRQLLGYDLRDLYWGALVGKGHKGGYCMQPSHQVRVIVGKGKSWEMQKCIGSVKEVDGVLTFTGTWGDNENVDQEYRYLLDLTGDALITALDALILVDYE